MDAPILLLMIACLLSPPFTSARLLCNRTAVQLQSRTKKIVTSTTITSPNQSVASRLEPSSPT